MQISRRPQTTAGRFDSVSSSRFINSTACALCSESIHVKGTLFLVRNVRISNVSRMSAGRSPGPR